MGGLPARSGTRRDERIGEGVGQSTAAEERLGGTDDEPGDRPAGQRRERVVDAAATAIPAGPAKRKVRNPAVQVAHVRRNDGWDTAVGLMSVSSSSWSRPAG
jgi:hypothetical protein